MVASMAAPMVVAMAENLVYLKAVPKELQLVENLAAGLAEM